MKNTGRIALGVRTPFVKEGDELETIVVNSVLKTLKENNYKLEYRDIIGITESLLARSQGNFVTTDDIAKDIRDKFPEGEAGVIFPIMSRNRFAQTLKGIAKGLDKVYVQLSFPGDEVGNPIIATEKLLEKNIKLSDEFTANEWREIFGNDTHPFTGVNYIDLYESLAPNIKITLANDPRAMLKYTKNILISSIHRRKLDRNILISENNNTNIYDLTEVLNKENNNHGYCDFGLLGSNLSNSEEGIIKLFPRDGDKFVKNIKDLLYTETGAETEVMLFGDGAFKCPRSGIWELADPVVSPFYTLGLVGLPNDMKLKYLIDQKLTEEEILERIRNNKEGIGQLGTTPRQITDLVGSLCDLMSGSGDVGTPVILVKRYWKKYGEE